MSRRPVFPTLILMLGLAACGGGDEPPAPTAASLTAEGWRAFEEGDAALAVERFEAALVLDDVWADAHTGLGWVALRSAAYGAAGGRFDVALALDPAAHDARSGRILVLAAAGDDGAMIAEADALLAAAPSYRFAHDTTWSASDVRWLIARAAFDGGDYARTVAELDVLSPGHGLAVGQAGFAERALALLEALRKTV